jgi:hypothetical protein
LSLETISVNVEDDREPERLTDFSPGKVDGGTTETTPWVESKPKPTGHGSRTKNEISMNGRNAANLFKC